MERSNRYVREYGLEVLLLIVTLLLCVVMLNYQRPAQSAQLSSAEAIIPIKLPASVEHSFRSSFAVE